MAASHNAPRHSADVSPEVSRGFAITLPSAQLGDLIQINCINRVRGAFRVASSGGTGQLFFDAGLLVHASCGDQVGLDAVVKMLGWTGGSVEPCELAWPAESSIGMGADALLLHAAQRLDERTHAALGRADATTKVVRRVALPSDAAPALDARVVVPNVVSAEARAVEARAVEARAVEARAVEAPAGERLPADLEPVVAEPRRASEHSGLSLKSALSLDGLSRLEVVSVAPDGNIQHLRAGASPDLADTAFFCQQLGSLIGEGLGLGSCRALACENNEQGIVVFKGRAIIGARGSRRDLEVVLDKVGLG
jgi:hypothetical protein